MTFTKKVPLGGHLYLSEYESYWDRKLGKSRHRFLRYLGRCDKSGNLITPVKPRVESVHSSFPVGSLAAFYAGARELSVVERASSILKVHRPVAQAFLGLGLNQVVHRLALRHVADWVHESPLPTWEKWDVSHLGKGDFERALDALSDITKTGTRTEGGHALQDGLTREWRDDTREPAGYYYDFDTTKVRYYGNTLSYAEMGHASDRSIRTVVGFGLVTSRVHHHPVQCRPIVGSRSDMISVDETVARMEAAGLKGVTLVMDRGMVSAENLKVVRKAGYHQVGMVRDGTGGWWEGLGKWSEEALERPEHLVVRPSGERLYARAWTGSMLEQPHLRLALVVDPEEKEADRLGRAQRLRELQGNPGKLRLRELRQELKVQDPRRQGKGGHVPGLLVGSAGRRGFRVDPEAVKEDQVRDGRRLLFSTDGEMSAEEMCRAYFERDAIEKSFRTAKGPMSLAPIRYRSEVRLDAYSTVLYLGLLLWSWEERKLRKKYPRRTLEDALWSLRDVSLVRIGSGKTVREFITRLSDEQKELLDLLGGTSVLPVP
ncbi:transposase IS4 family protein [mine drainage metagenome]|uniref:Transposase IS4 family protein n=3 Tax=mine drainage metagenome TaxID=410659 RepID=T1C7S8_9ZZZZ